MEEAMRFKQPLTGKYQKINLAFMRERSQRENDPRNEFYKAILAHDRFDDYYRETGEEYVQPDTTSYAVNVTCSPN
jgi:hypothetical protein